MAEYGSLQSKLAFGSRSTEWGAIWAGVLSFFSIWIVFGAVGLAIFARATSPTTLTVRSGWGIWIALLTIGAMYVAGLVTAIQAVPISRSNGVVHGMSVFGLTAAIGFMLTLAVGISLNIFGQGGFGTQTPYALGLVSGLRGNSTVLLLSWLAALLGASARVRMSPSATVSEIRPAA